MSSASAAAATVSSRATSSNDAGTVRTTSCSASRASGCAASQAPRRCAKNRADAATGDTRGTSSDAPQGRILAVRSTPPCASHDFAEVTSRPGTRPPSIRASSPTTSRRSSAHGNASAPAGTSCAPARYSADGSVGRSPTRPSATSCGTGSDVIARRRAARSIAAIAEFVVPRSMPTA